MKRIFLLALLISSVIFANGVIVVDAQSGLYLKLLSSKVEVTVENQVAQITTIQSFKNQFTSDKVIKYIFPLPEGASATGLEYYINGSWHTAQISAGTPDTTLPGPGGNINANLKAYIGASPLYFGISEAVHPDSLLIVKLKYVQLLNYSFGIVRYTYPNDYHLIQNASLTSQEFEFNLTSARTIDSLRFLNLNPQVITNNGHTGFISYNIFEQSASNNYEVEYSLNSNELGLFSMSSKFQEGTLPDSIANGFFIFVAEPNPNTTTIIRKVFTLIVDRSGSMGGPKMDQAKSAATFIVNNLNEGDKFNIIDFDDIITSFKPGHVLYTTETKQEALDFINNLYARGMTNISGAFSTAIPQFNNVNDSTANIIIFFTDGQATAGVTGTEELVTLINSLANQVDSSLCIFNFGIGGDVNKQLLTLIADQHNGLSEFLENNELETKISEFYLKIKNPVLINTSLSITPEVIIEKYPDPLPNLYKGQQLIVAGRYQEPGQVTVTLNGKAFGQPVSYSYPMTLSDSSIEKYRFQTKIWAKLKIENLLVKYYKLSPNSPAAIALKNQIINLSVNFGVSSPFTSFITTDINDPLFEIQRRGKNSQWETISSFKCKEISSSSMELLSFMVTSEKGKVTITWSGSEQYVYVDYVNTTDVYSYRLKQIDNEGRVKYSAIVTIDAIAPVEFGLNQNYPNPFNPSTSIKYSVGGTAKVNVRLKIFNTIGQEVFELVNEEKEPGNYVVEFNASKLSTGVYFYRIDAGEFSSTKKMIYLK